MLYEPSDTAYSTAADFGNVEASGAARNKELIGVPKILYCSLPGQADMLPL